jgi:hypothetical protein
LKQLIEKIFNEEELKTQPPVLLDIGAAGEIHNDWKLIAPYSVCIAFDADKRDFGFIEQKSSEYKKLFVFNCIVTDQKTEEAEFYLTKSPHCSSLLKPDNENLADWKFSGLFEIERTTRLKTKNLNSVLKELKIEQIDWFKTDSQGIDLRLFKCLDKNTSDHIIIADFEPGIIPAYKGEDKLHQLMDHMDNLPFWISDMEIRGSERIKKDFNSIIPTPLALKQSPGWCLVTYINNFMDQSLLNKRDLLLGWTIASLKKQHGFALELSIKGEKELKESLFSELKNFSLNELHVRKTSLKKKIKNKLTGLLNKL